MQIKHFVFNLFQENCFLAWDESGACVIVDPGCMEGEIPALTTFVESKKLNPVAILLTHGHFDHIYGVKALQDKYSIPVYLHQADIDILGFNAEFASLFGMAVPDMSFSCTAVREGDKVRAGSLEFELIETPGHTPGGACWFCAEERLLFSGDTLFKGSIGRTDNVYGDYDALMEGINGKLMGLDGDIDVLCGHGPATSIAEERQRNPFLQPFNEPFTDDFSND